MVTKDYLYIINEHKNTEMKNSNLTKYRRENIDCLVEAVNVKGKLWKKVVLNDARMAIYKNTQLVRLYNERGSSVHIDFDIWTKK